ncbi:hypothetical protein RQL66_011425 [Citrobacter freundii]|uniref:hypothetical protein n=1 Tax=Citrobacter freundii TaxID=546 RepID=UPI00313DB7FC
MALEGRIQNVGDMAAEGLIHELNTTKKGRNNLRWSMQPLRRINAGLANQHYSLVFSQPGSNHCSVFGEKVFGGGSAKNTDNPRLLAVAKGYALV